MFANGLAKPHFPQLAVILLFVIDIVIENALLCGYLMVHMLDALGKCFLRGFRSPTP